jgi:hypothetical protein
MYCSDSCILILYTIRSQKPTTGHFPKPSVPDHNTITNFCEICVFLLASILATNVADMFVLSLMCITRRMHFNFLYLTTPTMLEEEYSLSSVQSQDTEWQIKNLIYAKGWTIGVLEFDSRRGLGIFLFTTAFRMALGPTQSPIQWVPVALSLGVKRQGREDDHSSPSSVEVKNALSYTSTPLVRLHGVVLS